MAFRDIVVSALINIFSICVLLIFSVHSALKQLVEEKSTVHRDISYSNILLLESDVNVTKDRSTQATFRPGLLINFEYAARLTDAYVASPGPCTVCISLFSFSFLFLICLAGYITIHGYQTTHLSKFSNSQALS